MVSRMFGDCRADMRQVELIMARRTINKGGENMQDSLGTDLDKMQHNAVLR